MPAVSICLLLSDQEDSVTFRNINYLNRWIGDKPELRFEIVVFYTSDLDILKLSETYPNLRWWRLLRLPLNMPFLIRKFSQKIRSNVLIYVSEQTLISKNDIISFGNACHKEDVVFSFSDDLAPVHISDKGPRLRSSVGYRFNQMRAEMYASLNDPYRTSSFEVFAINIMKLDELLRRTPRKQLFEIFRQKFAHIKFFLRKQERTLFDYSILRLIEGSNKKIHFLGKGISRRKLPVDFWLFPLFLSYKQLFLIFKLEKNYRCGIRILNYKRILLVTSFLSFFIFLLLSYLGYKGSWLLFVFFMLCNLPMIFESNSKKVNFKLLLKSFLALLI